MNKIFLLSGNRQTAVVAAGAVVTKDVPRNTVVGGIPAKVQVYTACGVKAEPFRYALFPSHFVESHARSSGRGRFAGGSACANNEKKKVPYGNERAGSQPSSKGPADWFTGTVRVDPLFSPNEPARTAGASVTFEPGARTAWHTHPLGQTLIVTAGAGRVQREGGPVEEIRPGDVVQFAPNEKHWHGAAPSTAMTHIAIQEALDGKMVDWMEKVSETQYGS